MAQITKTNSAVKEEVINLANILISYNLFLVLIKRVFVSALTFRAKCFRSYWGKMTRSN